MNGNDFRDFLNEFLLNLLQSYHQTADKCAFLDDNGRAHKSMVVNDFLIESSTKSMAIAPYSPETNFAESIFLILRTDLDSTYENSSKHHLITNARPVFKTLIRKCLNSI